MKYNKAFCNLGTYYGISTVTGLHVYLPIFLVLRRRAAAAALEVHFTIKSHMVGTTETQNS